MLAKLGVQIPAIYRDVHRCCFILIQKSVQFSTAYSQCGCTCST